MKITPLLLINKHHKKWHYRNRYALTHNQNSIQFDSRVLHPIALKPIIEPGSTMKVNNMTCIQEIFNMMACLKKNEFDEGNCAEEIRKYRYCNDHKLRKSQTADVKKKLGLLSPGLNVYDLSEAQKNALLSKFSKK